MRLVIVTAPPDDGVSLARTMVEEKLAACANIVPKVRSIYTWNGKVEDEEEVMILFKTTDDGIAALTHRIKAIHPYDVPEIITVEINEREGNPDYFSWVGTSVYKSSS